MGFNSGFKGLNKTLKAVLPLIEQALRASSLEFEGNYCFK